MSSRAALTNDEQALDVCARLRPVVLTSHWRGIRRRSRSSY